MPKRRHDREMPPVKDFGCMTAAEEAAMDIKFEKSMQSQRELKCGRNFLWNTFHCHDEGTDPEFHRRYDETFPEAPGSPGWLDKKYCPDCGKSRAWCECSKKRAEQ